MKKELMPGVWQIDSEVHIYIQDVIAHLGIQNTPENVTKLEEAIRQVAKETSPDADVIVGD